ncbi:hypothetical protein BgAZ_502540 [Babesia gibsoni]|uniref:Uncharacterized protein n=1 Tax=Babesia gibsoni TaxID=33632 RepID=A0AAD8LHY5_BABGI|nr:hypothetical protein BgAZ_502540 [Babesia gibsoni]
MMQCCIAIIYACLLTLIQVEARCLKPGGRYALSAIGGSGIHERTFQRRWRLLTSLASEVESNIRQEIVKLAAQLPNSRNLPLKDSGFLAREASKIRNLLVPEWQDVYLNKYWAVERIQHLGFLGDVVAWLFGTEDYVTFSAWQYRPNIFHKGGNLTLEIHYKIPIDVADGVRFLFEPIVVYTCDVSPGKYVPGSARFSTGTVEILTHPFIPWKKFHAGTVEIIPPRAPTEFNP